jgi:hypothetical protein
LHLISFVPFSPQADFLDDAWRVPALELNDLNPLLLQGVPLLRQAYRLRAQLASIVEQLSLLEPNVLLDAVEQVFMCAKKYSFYHCHILSHLSYIGHYIHV